MRRRSNGNSRPSQAARRSQGRNPRGAGYRPVGRPQNRRGMELSLEATAQQLARVASLQRHNKNDRFASPSCCHTWGKTHEEGLPFIQQTIRWHVPPRPSRLQANYNIRRLSSRTQSLQRRKADALADAPSPIAGRLLTILSGQHILRLSMKRALAVFQLLLSASAIHSAYSLRSLTRCYDPLTACEFPGRYRRSPSRY